MEQELIHLLFDMDEYKKYSPYITKDIIVDSDYKLSEELWNIYLRLGKYYEANEDAINTSDLKKIMLIERENTSEASRELLKDAFKDVSNASPTQTAKEMLKALRERSVRYEAMDLISDGEQEEAIKLLKSIDNEVEDHLPSINMSVVDTQDEALAASRWRWWSPSLDKLLEGFGEERGLLLMALPNGGKTSTLCNMSVGFARQGAKVLHIVVAEDSRVKLRNRYYSVAYNVDDEELSRNLDQYDAQFVEEFGKGGDTEDSNIYVLPYPTLNMLQLRKAIEKIKPDIVILDPITKVAPMSKKDKRDDLILAEVGGNLESLSMEYKFGFICVIQAGTDAEFKKRDGSKTPKRWLDMSDAFNSNTAIQGEFQSILGLGMDGQGVKIFTNPDTGERYGAEYRYMNVCKSKSKSGRVTLIFNPNTGLMTEERTC